MLEPRPPVDVSRPDRFRPPHCPYPDCPDHLHDGAWDAYKKDGHFRRKADPWRRQQRFRCKSCGRCFSRQSFSSRYYMKRPELLTPVAKLLISGCCHRQIARFLQCAPSTVTRLCARLGRHASLFHELATAQIDRLAEPIVLDHFDTFYRSQLERIGLATAVGGSSWYVYSFEGARYRGSSRRARHKRALRHRPEPPPPGELIGSTLKVLERLLGRAAAGLRLITDGHAAYPAAIRQLGATGRVTHEVHVSPQSRGSNRANAARYRRAMFPVNLLHTIVRHSQAGNRRETIAYGRSFQSVVGRAAILAVWRNFVKLKTERRRCSVTPAIELGLTHRIWSWNDVLAERLFAARIALISA